MTSDERSPIILCGGAHGRAVVFGYVDREPVPGEPVTMHDSRMVLRWVGNGLFGVAADGPLDGTRLTATVARVVETKWQEWIAVSPAAAERLATWPE